MKRLRSILLFFSALIVFSSCNGIFGGIYDEPKITTGNEYGFISVDKENNSGRIYINATNYDEWTYINLYTKKIEIKKIDTLNPTNNQEPQEWDFAMHRYDVKTNNGAAFATQYATLDELRASAIRPDSSNFIADTLGKVTVDMSKMMDGILVYYPSMINKVLSSWLDVNMSEMPPIYTLSKKVYFLRLRNGEYAALLFSNYMNDANEKGYVTIDYIYPY